MGADRRRYRPGARQAAGARPPIRAPEARCGSCAPSRRPALPRAARRRARVHRRAATRAPPRDPARDAARRDRRARRAHPRHARRRRQARGRPPAASRALPARRRRRPRDWLAALLAHAEQIVTGAYASRRPAPGRARRRSSASRRGCAAAAASTRSPHSRLLWVDVDEPGELPALWALLAERPCHLLIESGGSGGVHAYWKLDEPLAATRRRPGTGEVIEPIERANLRLIHALGVDADGRPCVADPPAVSARA